MEDPLAQPWDDSLKKLVHAAPQSFVRLVDPTATFLHEIKEQLKPLTRNVDGLLLTQREDGKQELIHLKLQSTNDPEMPDRMLVYHVLARTQYRLPIRSCVIYLPNFCPK
jgi:predicted transposase YdaD